MSRISNPILSIANTPEALAQAVVQILHNPELGEQLRCNRRRWVEERYNWRRTYAQWSEVYTGLLAN